MKKIITVILSVIIVCVGVFSASAKNVVNYGDWVLEKINNDTQWELDEYTGADTEIITPRIIDNMLVVSYGSHCFANDSNLKSVITSSPLWTIGEYAFIDCSKLEYFELNYALRTIDTGAFYGTSSLKSINLEDSVVTEIKPYTFMNSGLETARFPATCTKLGAYSFSQCKSLTKAFIPNTVTEIDDTAFYGCSNLTIYCLPGSYAASYAEENDIDCVTLGDVNGDGSVTIRDATYIQLYIAALSTLDDTAFMRADVNSDGKVNIRDVTYIQMYRAELIDSFYNI